MTGPLRGEWFAAGALLRDDGLRLSGRRVAVSGAPRACALAERNVRIAFALYGGATVPEVAARFGLGRARAGDIARALGFFRRERAQRDRDDGIRSQVASGAPVREVARRADVSAVRAYRIANEGGVYRRPRWSAAEIGALRSLWAAGGIDLAAAHLSRSRKAIRMRAHLLGLPAPAAGSGRWVDA